SSPCSSQSSPLRFPNALRTSVNGSDFLDRSEARIGMDAVYCKLPSRPVLGADLNCSESVWALSGSASQMIARQQQPAAVRNLNPAYVRFGSKAEKLAI